MNKKYYYAIGAAVVLIGVISFFIFRSPAKAATGDAITGTVTRADINQSITSTGVIQQPQTYNLSFKGQNMKIAQVNAAVGDTVKTGEVVAQADLTSLNNQVEQARATMNLAKAKLDKTKAGTSPKDLADAQAKVSNSLVAQINAQTTYNSDPSDKNKAALDAANYSLASAQADLATKQSAPSSLDLLTDQTSYDQAVTNYNIAVQNVADATLTSPVDGTVIAENGKAGEVASQQLPVLTIQSNSNDLQIMASVDESDIGNVKVGQSANVTLDSYPGKIFPGKVVLISPQATTQSNVTYFNVTIAITNQDNMLKTGMNANIAIQTASVKNVLAVPSEAVKESNNEKYVQVMDPATNQPSRTKVEIGIDNGTLAEVKSGLQPGDTVLLGYKSTTTSTSSSSSQRSGIGGGGGGGGSVFRAMGR